MADFITPEYIYEIVSQEANETRHEYLDRLRRIILDDTAEPMLRTAANNRYYIETSYE